MFDMRPLCGIFHMYKERRSNNIIQTTKPLPFYEDPTRLMITCALNNHINVLTFYFSAWGDTKTGTNFYNKRSKFIHNYVKLLSNLKKKGIHFCLSGKCFSLHVSFIKLSGLKEFSRERNYF